MWINKDTIIGDILDFNGSCEEVFTSFDMPCTDCPSARGETLQEACELHGVNLEELMQVLDMRLGNKAKE